MDSKTKISYRLQIFFPLVFFMWLALICMGVWAYFNDISKLSVFVLYLFYALLFVAIILTIIAHLSSRRIARNIHLLRDMAERVARDVNFIPANDFPNDELGDISRQIVHIYNERTRARKQQKREHEVAMHAIEEKIRNRRQMTNNINHELRTPISVIKGYIDTILENPEMDEQTRVDFLYKTREHANRLVSLITDVSAITRLEEGGDMISTEELDFYDLAFSMANEIEMTGVLGNLQFDYDIPLKCKVLGNYNLLYSMLMNLARNAATYSKGTLCELLYQGEDEKFVSFVFWDNGIGVGEEHLPHLFDRFYRIDAGRSRKSGGTGLGLPIVQSTILAHGGDIRLENRPTGGLCCRFTLQKATELKR